MRAPGELLFAAGLVFGLAGGAVSAADTNTAPLKLPLYENTAAPAEAEIEETAGGNHVLRNVTVPDLSVYLPEAANASGAGVIIAPGGAFMMLSIDNEGHDVARWLAQRGVAAFVLKYRLEHTPSLGALFSVLLGKRVIEATHRSAAELPKYAGEDPATADVLQALRVVKRRAPDWKLDPQRIGLLGFSAGAVAAIRAATEYDADTRPAFLAAIYGSRTPRAIPADAPPLFAAIAADDPFFPEQITTLYSAWRKAGRPAELHVYDKGGHGFGIKPQGTSSDHWPEEFAWWLQARGFVPGGKP